MLLVIPEKNLLVLDDLLHGRAVGTTANACRTSTSRASPRWATSSPPASSTPWPTRRTSRLSPEVPEISIDMCLPVIDSVLARFNQPGDKLLLTEAVIYGDGAGQRGLPPGPVPGAGFAAQAHGRAGGERQSGANPPSVAPNPPAVAQTDMGTWRGHRDREDGRDGRGDRRPEPEDHPRLLRRGDPPRPRAPRERACAHHAARPPARRRGRRASTPIPPIPALSRAWQAAGAATSSLQALLIGGAQMFPMGNSKHRLHRRPERGGRAQGAAGKQDPHRVRGHGGKAGRSVMFDNATGQVSVKTLQAIERKGRDAMSALGNRSRARRAGAHLTPGDLRQVPRADLREDRHPHARRQADPHRQPAAQAPGRS